MPQNNRNSTRNRKDMSSRRYNEEEAKRYSAQHQDERERNMNRVSYERTDQRSTERENDLYERQSI